MEEATLEGGDLSCMEGMLKPRAETGSKNKKAQRQISELDLTQRLTQ
jgi:hypothetical protein